MKMIIAGGGTGGHIYPAVSIANEVSARFKDSEILFIGTKYGLESTLVPKAGYNIEFIKVEGLCKKVIKNTFAFLKFGTAIIKCLNIISKFEPDIVVGTGGYVSAPVIFAAKLLNIPIVIHEQNAIAGKTTSFLTKYADTVCVAFDDKKLLNCPHKTVVTGNPIRESFSRVNKGLCRKKLGFDDSCPLILCVSGSLGAKKVNEYVVDFIKENYKNNDFQLVLVTGDRYYSEIVSELEAHKIEVDGNRIYVKNYVHDIENYMAAADLVISRSGAIFLSEIAYLGKASILIPSPNVANNHQEYNADRFAQIDAAVKITEQDLNEKVLEKEIYGIINDIYRMQVMGYNAKKLSVKDSAAKIVDEIEKLLASVNKNIE